MIKKIDHIAIAVKDMEEGIKRYRDVLGLEFHGTEVVPGQKVIVAFFRAGGLNIELTTPTEEDSPMAKSIHKRGPGIHHIAFEVDDIEAQIRDFREKGIRMIDDRGRDGADNAKIAFAHPDSFAGVLVELKEKLPRK